MSKLVELGLITQSYNGYSYTILDRSIIFRLDDKDTVVLIVENSLDIDPEYLARKAIDMYISVSRSVSGDVPLKPEVANNWFGSVSIRHMRLPIYYGGTAVFTLMGTTKGMTVYEISSHVERECGFSTKITNYVDIVSTPNEILNVLRKILP